MIDDTQQLYQQSLSTFMADVLWKYKGWSFLGEYFLKSAPNPVLMDSTGTNRLNSFYTGTGFNAQLGYVFKSNWEIAGRYTIVNPDEGVDVKLGDQTQYTLGLSRYLLGHALKFQTDLTYSVYELVPSASDNWQFRFQMEIAL